MSRFAKTGEFLASLPYQVGYELGDDHVVFVTIEPGHFIGRMGIINLSDHESQLDAAETLAALMQRDTREIPGRQFMTIGYGAMGPENLTAVAEAYCASGDFVAPYEMHVQDTTWRARTSYQDPWVDGGELPDVSAIAVGHGFASPAPTRQEHASRYAPLPQATYPVTPEPAVQTLLGQAPSFRAEVAIANLDALAKPNVEDAAQRRSLIAHVMLSDVRVRDALIVHAAGSEETAEALVQVYRGGGPELASKLGPATATALHMNNGQANGVRTIIENSERDTLSELVTRSVKAGLEGTQLRDGLRAEIPHSLERADAQWRAAQRRAAAFPAPPQLSTEIKKEGPSGPRAGPTQNKSNGLGGHEQDGLER